MTTIVKPEKAVGSALQSALNACGFVGTWETDLETKTVYPSGPFAGLIGVDEERALAGISLETFFDGLHPDDRQRVREAVKVAHSTAGRFESEFRTIASDGSLRWVTARGQVEIGRDGRGLRCLGVAVDVTDTRGADVVSDQSTIRIIHHLIDAMIAAQTSIASLGTPILKSMIDMLLIQLGKELMGKTTPSADQRLH